MFKSISIYSIARGAVLCVGPVALLFLLGGLAGLLVCI